MRSFNSKYIMVLENIALSGHLWTSPAVKALISTGSFHK